MLDFPCKASIVGSSFCRWSRRKFLGMAEVSPCFIIANQQSSWYFMQLPQNQQVSPTVQLPGAKTQGSWGNDPCKTLHNYIHPIPISFPSSHSSGVFPTSNSARCDLSTKSRFSFERLSVKTRSKRVAYSTGWWPELYQLYVLTSHPIYGMYNIV